MGRGALGIWARHSEQFGRFDAALTSFTAVVAEQPMSGPASGVEKGLCEFQLGSFDAAVIDLLKAREIGVAENRRLARVVR